MVARLVHHKFWVGFFTCIVQKSPVVEQMFAKASAIHFLQKLLWNDRIGIDVGGIKRND
ncbi:Uncharacterised protein [Vibrio cholerae]|nr:Uncharacterised protein [Vibrio cholerae]